MNRFEQRLKETMARFEAYLINIGMHFQVAGRYGRIAEKYIRWLKEKNLKPEQVKKRSLFTEWLQHCREVHGNCERTITIKENVIKHYYYFLGTKHNPALLWLKKQKIHTLPPTTIPREDLTKIYASLKPKSPADYRDRCMLGLVLFQGLKRSEVMELRIGDVDFEAGEVFIQGQLRTNGRRLNLESAQTLHLYDYLNRYRKEFIANKPENDFLFLAKGDTNKLANSIGKVLGKLKKEHPEIINLLHIRMSVITHWQEEEGIMEAMVKAGHRYVSSTQRYQTSHYEELHDQLKAIHPLEIMEL